MTTTQKPYISLYYPEWGTYGRDAQVADIPGDKITNLIYAFAAIDTNGKLALYDNYADVEKHFAGDSWNDPAGTIYGNFHQIELLKKEYPDLKVDIAIGGWTLSGQFSDVAATAESRKVFADSAVAFLQKYPMFDGLDFDWEYPGGGGLAGNKVSVSDGANYALLLKDVRTALNSLSSTTGRSYEITVAAPAGSDKIANFNLAGLEPYVDRFNMMAYDFHGAWESTTDHQAPLYSSANGDTYSIDYAVKTYLAAGIPANKIVLGAPMYDRAWSGVANGGDGGYDAAASGAAPGSFEAGVYDYKDMLQKLNDPNLDYKLYYDDQAQAAYVYSEKDKVFASFENAQTIAIKSEYAKSLGLGGMMFWDASGDARGADSLVTAAYKSWIEGKSYAEVIAGTTLVETVIGGDGIVSPVTAAGATVGSSTGTTSSVGSTTTTGTSTTNSTSTTGNTATAGTTATATGTATGTTAGTASSTTTATIVPQTGNLAVVFGGTGWGTDMTGSVTVTNTGDKADSSWQITFESKENIGSVWNAVVVSKETLDSGKYRYTVANESYNGAIAAGAAVQWGFNATCTAAASFSGAVPSGTFTVTGLSSVTAAGTTPATTGTGTGTNTGNNNSGTTVVDPTVVVKQVTNEKAFAPYIDITAYPTPDILTEANQYGGIRNVKLAFVQSDVNGKAAWGGLSELAIGGDSEQAVAIADSIARYKSAGGTVTVSFGGANGISLAEYYSSKGKTAQELADAYGKIVSSLGINALDFDVEGGSVLNTAANTLNGKALSLLQTAKPEVSVWFTLPVATTGISAGSLSLVETALKSGVTVAGVNVMAMDYGDSDAPPNAATMGQYAIKAATATYNQMTALYAKYDAVFNWSQIGVTPMIGLNDVNTEKFTLADEQALEAFAVSKGIGQLSMWSINRDNATSAAWELISATASSNGMANVASNSYGLAFSDYGDKPASGALTAVATSTNTATAAKNVSLDLTFSGTGWGGGFQSSVSMQNTGDSLNKWSVCFISPHKISSIWEAKVESSQQLADGQYLYKISNTEWSGSVKAGETKSWGFCASSGSGILVNTVSNADFTVLKGDVISGTDGNDVLAAANVNSALLGGAGNDTLTGGTGNDNLFGGMGNNTLTGGAGSDKFHWEQGSSGLTTVTDLENVDKMVLYLKQGQSVAAKVNGSDLMIGNADSGLLVKNWVALGNGGANTIQSGSGKVMTLGSNGTLI